MMLGATLCNGVLHLSAIKSGSVNFIFTTLKNIMKINQMIMAPSFILLITSGLLMAQQFNLSFNTLWLKASIVLTFILVLEFIFGYKIEKKLEKIAQDSVRKKHKEIQKSYWKQLKIAYPIGSSATIFSLIIIYLMIVKPT
jgi:uncharacterized membrane protein